MKTKTHKSHIFKQVQSESAFTFDICKRCGITTDFYNPKLESERLSAQRLSNNTVQCISVVNSKKQLENA